MKLRHLTLIPALALLGGGCWDKYLSVCETSNTPIIFEKPSRQGNVEAGGIPSATTTSDVQLPPAPPLKPGEIASTSGNVVVTSLAPNQALASPFVIMGRARAFESVISWRVRDRNGAVLASGSTNTDAADVGLFGAFRIRAFLLQVPKTTSGKIEVYTNSPRDGSIQDLVAVPVKLGTEAAAVKAYFYNIQKDPDLKACDKTYPVTRRVVKTQNAAEAAILELLDGPTASEEALGSRTAIIPSTELLSVAIERDVASVNFSKSAAIGFGDECTVKAFKSQVEQTLKQFSAVKVVRISIQGVDIETLLKK